MAKIVGLPKLSPTMEEGTLAKWNKKEGDEVGIDDLIAEIETDKATMEWRSFDKGVLLRILAPEGTTLAPDQPVAIFGQKGDDIAALLAQIESGAGEPTPTAPQKKSDEPKAESTETATSKKTEDSKSAAPQRTGKPESVEGKSSSGRVLASPLVRRLAREHDVDLRTIEGTGPHGRIIKKDFEQHRSGPASTSSSSPVQGRPPAREEKLSQMRKTIARRLTESKRDVPHFYLTIDIDAQPLWDARIAINSSLEKSGEKVSLNDILIKACAVALRRFPAANSSFAGDRVLRHQVVDISVAVAIDEGLVTPVLRDADRKGVLELSKELKELAARAREKKLKPEEMQNGTFSISNLGMFGIEDFSAVINPPEGAILAVGAVREEPVVENGVIAPGRRLRMTLSCDHRVIDGAVGAQFLALLRGLLESPIQMIV